MLVFWMALMYGSLLVGSTQSVEDRGHKFVELVQGGQFKDSNQFRIW